jgi:hypothetical protein
MSEYQDGATALHLAARAPGRRDEIMRYIKLRSVQVGGVLYWHENSSFSVLFKGL